MSRRIVTTTDASTTLPMKAQYPGWSLDLRWTVQENCDYFKTGLYPVGVHHNCFGANSELLPVREVAMMMVMDALTDKPDWHIKVFDDEIVGKWRQEALAWHNEELYRRIQTFADLDCEPSEYDPKTPKNILDEASIDYCIEELREKAEYYKKTGIVPTLDATHSVAKSDTIIPHDLHLALREAFQRLKVEQSSNPDWHPNTNEIVQDLVHPSMYPLVYGRSRFLEDEPIGVEDALSWVGKGITIPHPPSETKRPMDYGVGGGSADPSFWSTEYQWLPANLKFTDSGGVKFTSYINNLHPIIHRSIYTTLEKLVDTALPMWDQCLGIYTGYNSIKGPGRRTPRIKPQNPELNSDSNPRNWDIGSAEEMLRLEGETDPESRIYNDENGEIDERWSTIRQPINPAAPPFIPGSVNYDIDPTRTLRSRFGETGLQIIVKMVSVELTPDKPFTLPGGWHVEGQMNEHIIGTALYYLDCENVTDVRLDFQSLTDSYQDEYEMAVGQDGYYWMNSTYGTKLGCGAGGECVQRYGNVVTKQGRMIAFPNVFHHRVEGLRLLDGTKPGHRRFVALWLVDPMVRVIGTANVPPQRADWVDGEVEGTMGREEAEGHRRRLTEIRSAREKEGGAYWAAGYNFCEH
ncbi:hypothetical protein OQA88_7384 [Cercophora sp. LCS_1]